MVNHYESPYLIHKLIMVNKTTEQVRADLSLFTEKVHNWLYAR
ncbi:hypothetical protein GGQ60_003193 [Pedobacter zeae]|uniref:Uncharacterized protein n=1 Tax=Pedobacter zeae TaxID=1737356 RepID=A0A7W6KCG2_9SPHI|nr:hypothetical protein [Pedobacter zeae]